MVELQLSRNMSAIVDKEDLEIIGQFKWYAKSFKNGIYAARNDYSEDKKSPKTLLLHRVLMGAEEGQYVDHISRDTLDNRRCNLRIVTNAQNMWNQRMRSNNTSGYKGVSWHPVNKSWTARLDHNGEKIQRAGFKSRHDAARFYNDAALKYHGEFARLNIIKGE